MKNTDQILESVGESIGFAQHYVEQQLNYFRLEIAEKVSSVISSLVTMFVLFVLALLVITFGSTALALYLGDVLDSYPLAFALITLFYFLLGLAVYFFKRQMITNPIIAQVIDEIYHRKDDEEPERRTNGISTYQQDPVDRHDANFAKANENG